MQSRELQIVISECNAGLKKYRGVRVKDKGKRETGEDYMYHGTEVRNNRVWPWAASIRKTYKYRKNQHQEVARQ